MRFFSLAIVVVAVVCKPGVNRETAYSILIHFISTTSFTPFTCTQFKEESSMWSLFFFIKFWFGS